METLSDTSLGVTAEDFYESQRSKRTGPINVGRRLADISIPSVFPPENYETGQELAIPNQSINSHAINTLSSKMMLGAFPPGLPMAKIVPIEHKMDEDIRNDPTLYSEVMYALSRREETHRTRMETTGSRSAYVKLCKLLLTTGNGLTIWTDIDTPIIHNMDSYVVKRDAGGTPLVTVLMESVSKMVADDDVVAAAERNRSEDNETGELWDEDIKVFHVEKLVRDGDKKEWVYWQEVEGGAVVEDSVAYSHFDTPTMYPAWMIPEYGSNWGIPYCQDYEGDMQAVETFSAALQDGAAADSRYLTLVNPQGITDLRDVRDADNLETIPGREEDITVMRSGKGGDLRTASEQFEAAYRRLGQAFLMFSSIQRKGERVTAEEWRVMTQELEQATGGLYSLIANTVQRYHVLRFMFLHEQDDKELGKLPEGMTRTAISTGLDSMGQSSEGARLREFTTEAKETLGEQGLLAGIDGSDYLRRLAAIKSIKSEGLVKTSDQLAQDRQADQQQQQQQTLLDKATGPLAQGGADMLGKAMEQQQGEDQ